MFCQFYSCVQHEKKNQGGNNPTYYFIAFCLGHAPCNTLTKRNTQVPLQSKAQGRFLNARFGHGWVEKHHFGGSQKGLPQHVEKDNVGRVNVGLALFKAQMAKRKGKK